MWPDDAFSCLHHVQPQVKASAKTVLWRTFFRSNTATGITGTGKKGKIMVQRQLYSLLVLN